LGRILDFLEGPQFRHRAGESNRHGLPARPGGLVAVPVGEYAASVLDAALVPVTVYLADAWVHDQVEAAVTRWLEMAGLEVWDREEPVIGSWFRRMRAFAFRLVQAPAAREGALAAAHAVDQRATLAQDAAITAALLQNLGPVIGSLQPTKDAVLRVGALLIVKVDWVVAQLPAHQAAMVMFRGRLGLFFP
jgi:hypothetical protein